MNALKKIIRNSNFWLLLSLALFLRYQFHLLSFMEWGDESETIVAAKMIAAGSQLYSDFFNHHGPLVFLSGTLLELIGNFGVEAHRIPIALLQWGVLLAIFTSPLLYKKAVAPLYLGFAFFFTAVYLPRHFGHMYKYQSMAGAFIAIILAQLTLPTLYRLPVLGNRTVALCYFLLGCLPFFAVTYVPVTVLLGLSAIKRINLKPALLGLILGLVMNLGALSLIGSLKGFYAYHFYLNAKVLPHYNHYTSITPLIVAFNNILNELPNFILFLFIGSSLLLVFRDKSHLRWRSLTLLAVIGSFLIRRESFHALPFYYSLLALPMALIMEPKIDSRRALIAWSLAFAFFVWKLALLGTRDREQLFSKPIPKVSEFSELVKKVTQPGDKIIAYSFRNIEYILADRLPASGHYFYLPWQAKYNEAPVLGIKNDACAEIGTYRPKIMLVDKLKVWDEFPWESYGGCIDEILSKDYVKVDGKPYYLRKDIRLSDLGLRAETL